MRFDARDAGSYRHHAELVPYRPLLGRLHKRCTDATATCLGLDNQSDDLGAFTGLQQQTSLSGNPSNDARGLLRDDDEARICAQEYFEPLRYLIDRRRIPELRREASDRRSVVERSGTKTERGAQNGYLVREGLPDPARPSPSPRQTSS